MKVRREGRTLIFLNSECYIIARLECKNAVEAEELEYRLLQTVPLDSNYQPINK